MSERLFFVFDVESVGLHGEGYAVGWVLVSPDGREIDSGYSACPSRNAAGDDAGREWIMENVDPHLPHPKYETPRDVRGDFWSDWQSKKAGAVMAADVPWPVESRFLNDCVRDFGGDDEPYPLIDVASVRLAAGLDPLGTEPRLPNELPAHDPLADARQSARLLIEALAKARAGNWIESVS